MLDCLPVIHQGPLVFLRRRCLSDNSVPNGWMTRRYCRSRLLGRPRRTCPCCSPSGWFIEQILPFGLPTRVGIILFAFGSLPFGGLSGVIQVVSPLLDFGFPFGSKSCELDRFIVCVRSLKRRTQTVNVSICAHERRKREGDLEANNRCWMTL